MPTNDTSSAIPSRLVEFNEYFELSLALTRKQRDLVYEIRYRVYCEEFGYEPTSAFGNHQELDEFDCQSIHCLVMHKATGLPAGCVRVVMVEGSDCMPMEVHAADSMDRQFIDSFKGRRDSICEISRLAVDTGFRRRRGDWETRFGHIDAVDFSAAEQRSFPLIAMALMVGAGAVADAIGRKHCFAIMEPSLAILMKRAGIHFNRIGRDFEFRGKRAPYYGNLDELVESAPPEFQHYFNSLRQRFAAALLPKPLAAVAGEMVPACDASEVRPLNVPPGSEPAAGNACRFWPIRSRQGLLGARA